ncbi:hypothetical protein [Phenylobacterium montanum]|uniref:Uncharacterized protein n=1 Tax=Phenylobacterium montanum TaxID=2823693 RepID=A0A975FWR3_9CAUL|nr:hypothetical protein [Caulobacter sp. S6]QUD86825.1 hypothetical protein KCG34_17330 [Caulobacter sp. S6]
MRLPVFAALALTLASGASAATLPAPIAPASDGKLQCYSPDTSRKTCQSLAGYLARPDGGIDNPSTVLVATSPAIAMSGMAHVAVKGGQVCGFIRPEDIAASSFSIAGKPASDAQTARLRTSISAAMKPMYGQEFCTAYLPDGDGLIAKATIDGASQPGKDQRVIWVSPADGYVVAP